MVDWKPLYVNTPSDREATALALYRSGYEVRQSKRKEGNKTIVYLEYREASKT